MNPAHARTRRWGPSLDELVLTHRLVRLLPIVAAAAVGAVIVWRSRLDGDPADVVLATGLAVASAGVLGDRALVTLAASPTTRARRAVARLLLVVPVVVASWLVARGVARSLELGPTVDPATRWIPGVAPALLVLTFVIGAIAIDATVDRAGTTSGIVGASTALIAAAVSLHLPSRLNPYPVAEHRWWWSAVAVLVSALLVVALLDPGRSRRRGSTPRGEGRPTDQLSDARRIG